MAERAGLNIRQIAEALLVHKSVAEKRASKEAWRYEQIAVRGGKQRLYQLVDLPPVVQAAIALRNREAVPVARKKKAAAAASERIASAWQRYDRVSATLKAEADRRNTALRTVESLVEAGTPVMDARSIVAQQLTASGDAASAASIARWQAEVRGVERSDWLALLVPHYAGRTAQAEMPTEAWDTFKADWLRLECPSAESCYRRLERVAIARGWTLPSLKTFVRRLERELPRAVRVLARRGEDALMRTYPTQERDRSVFAALEAVNSDGHVWDVAVRFPDGTIGRPVIVGWQDLASGKLLAHRLGETESSDLVRLAFADLVETWGIPRHVYLDNGRSFASKWLTGGTPNRYRFKVREEDPTGVITKLVDQVHWVTPYHGQAKPIERCWRDLCDSVAKHPAFAGAYLGNNTTNKPENYGSRAIAWTDFERVVREEIAAHNARVGRRAKVCAGRSFDVTFAELYERATIRKATAEQLRTMLLTAEAVTASSVDGSVRVAGNRYWTEALGQHVGRKVVLRFDPMALHAGVHVYALDDSYVGYADCIASVGFADTNAAREHARATKDYRRKAKGMLDAERRMTAAQVAAQIPLAAPIEMPTAAVIAPVFGDARVRQAEAPAPLARTGTDEDASLSDFLKRIQHAQAADRL